MIVLSRIFAAIALLYSGALAIATFAWTQPWLQPLHTDNVIPTTFGVAAIFFVPFVITFTQLGLNTAEGEKSSPETTRRLSLLSTACPMWSVAWYSAIGLVVMSFGAFVIAGDSVNPFFAFSAAISGLSGMWFAFIYPTAKKLFGI